MSEDEYIKNRLDDQMNWYDKKSQYNQTCYKQLRIIEILAACSIPFLVGYIDQDSFTIQLTVGLLGIIIAVISGIISIYKFQENWVEYRTTCESLKHERYLFLTQVSPYHQADAFALLVRRVEMLISKENSQWSQYIQEDDQQANKSG